MDSAGFQSEVDAPDGEHNRNLRPGIVHRLDKGTTGVLLAAKNPTMQAKLGELFAERRVSKTGGGGGSRAHSGLAPVFFGRGRGLRRVNEICLHELSSPDSLFFARVLAVIS